MTGQAIRIQVHPSGDARVEATLALAAAATRGASLRATLDSLCRHTADLLSADVVSTYVLETEAETPWLVMRGNVGFPETAIDTARLRLGEGLTGFAAECLRPVSAVAATRDARYKHLPGLGEERFPAFVAIPLVSEGRAAGVLVLQRRGTRRFLEDEVLLATALSSAFTLAIDRAARRDTTRSTGGHRSVRLEGCPVVRGAAMGTAGALPSFGGLSTGGAAGDAASAAARAFDDVVANLRDALRRVGEPAGSHLVIEDERLRKRIREQCGAANDVVSGLREVARRYALTPLRLHAEDEPQGAWLASRAADVEDLCLLVAIEASAAEAWGPGRLLLLPDRLSPCVALAAVAGRTTGIAVGGPVDLDSPAAAWLGSAGIPVVAEIGGLFTWVQPGDRVLLDGSAGELRVGPTPGEVARLRRRRARRNRRHRHSRTA